MIYLRIQPTMTLKNNGSIGPHKDDHAFVIRVQLK